MCGRLARFANPNSQRIAQLVRGSANDGGAAAEANKLPSPHNFGAGRGGRVTTSADAVLLDGGGVRRVGSYERGWEPSTAE